MVQQNPFQLTRPVGAPAKKAAARLAERALGLSSLQRIYQNLPSELSPTEFAHQALDALGIELEYDAAELEHVPAEGATVVVANHPFGAPEGLALAAMLAQRRPDVRILANHFLARIPELRPMLIAVDAFGGEGAKERNRSPLREAIRFLREGGCLVVFPAGTVSHLHLKAKQVSDPPWSRHVATLLRRSQACAVPVFFRGRNSSLFQVAGLIHPKLRTALLPRELLKRSRSKLQLSIGRPQTARSLVGIQSDADLIEHLRMRTYLLAQRPGTADFPTKPRRSDGDDGAPIAPQEDRADLVADIAALPPERLTVASNGLEVYAAPAHEIPHVLREIGVLRERTFRTVGEGTGAERDLDRFDDHYVHLFVWDPEEASVLGSYRLAETERVLREQGIDGLYTSSLFDIDVALHRRLGPSLELGRSFVRLESQRASQGLFLLWRGIGRFVARHPEIRFLFGPLSISDAYLPQSQTLMAEVLRARRAEPGLCELVASKRPFQGSPLPGKPVLDVDAVAAAVADLERGKGVPVLLKEYAKLGAQVLELSVDPDFGNTLDALVLVDLPAAPRKLVARYVGADAVDGYIERHVGDPAELELAS